MTRSLQFCFAAGVIIVILSGDVGRCQSAPPAQSTILVGGKSLPITEDTRYLYVWRSAPAVDGHGAKIAAAHTMALTAVTEQSKAVGIGSNTGWAQPAGKKTVAIGSTASSKGKIIGTVVRRKPEADLQNIARVLDNVQPGTRITRVFTTPGFPKPFFVDRWIVVRAKDRQLTEDQQNLLHERYQVVVHSGRPNSGTWFLELGDNSPTPQVVAPELRNLDFIASAEFTFGYVTDDNCATTEMRGTPNQGDQWYLQQLHVLQAWNLIKASNKPPEQIRVAILDTGIDLKHPALAKRIIKGNDFLGGNENGGIVGTDPHYHGTACAGVIAAQATTFCNLTGIADAVNPSLIPVRIADDSGVITDFPIIQALDWILDLPDAVRPNILSCSFGETLPSSDMAARFVELEQKNVLVFAAAGNFGNNLAVSYPAAYPSVFAVGAVNQANGIQPYSQGGDESAGRVAGVAPSGGNTCDDASVPGIWTTDISDKLGRNKQAGDLGDYFGLFTGTSAATPMSAGVATLVWSMRPELKPKDIRCILERTAQKVPNVSDYPNAGKGRRPLYGYGLLSAERAVSLALQTKSDGTFVVAADPGCRDDTVAAASPPDTLDITIAGKHYVVHQNSDFEILRTKSDATIDWSRLLKPGTTAPARPVWEYRGIAYFSIPTKNLISEPKPNPEDMSLEPAWNLSELGGPADGWFTGELICRTKSSATHDELDEMAARMGMKVVYDKRGTVVLTVKDSIQPVAPVLQPALIAIGKLSWIQECRPDFSRRNTAARPD